MYWDRFGKYVAPKSNFKIARFKLRSMKQDNGESVDAFMKTVRILARECIWASVKLGDTLGMLIWRETINEILCCFGGNTDK